MPHKFSNTSNCFEKLYPEYFEIFLLISSVVLSLKLIVIQFSCKGWKAAMVSCSFVALIPCDFASLLCINFPVIATYLRD